MVIVVALLLVYANVDTVIQIANVNAIVGLAIIDIAALALALRSQHRGYACLAIVATVSALWQITLIPAEDIAWGIATLVAGFGLYGLRKVLYVAEHHTAIRASVKRGDTPLMNRLGLHK